jgi:hypothetical protein
MKLKLLIAVLMVVGAAEAKSPEFFQKGTLVKMESAECGVETKGAEGIGGALGVDDSQHSKARQMLCQQYLLRGEKLDYAIRPKEEKHPAILPIGEQVDFRIEKDRMYVRVLEMDKKERIFNVVAVSQRADENKSENVTAATK